MSEEPGAPEPGRTAEQTSTAEAGPSGAAASPADKPTVVLVIGEKE